MRLLNAELNHFNPLPIIEESRSFYFINKYIDLFFMGGASVICYFLFRFFHSAGQSSDVLKASGLLVWICNWPHFSATNFRFYQSKLHIREFPLTSWLIPLIVLAGVVGCFLSPNAFAPYFVKIYTIWSPYHFSGQTLGITLIYARRTGFLIGKWERLALSTFIYGTFFSQAIFSEVGQYPRLYYGISYPGLNLPAWLGTTSLAIMYLGAIFTAVFVIRWCIKQNRIVPLILLTPIIAQYVWFIPGAYWSSFYVFVPAFHSLQYLLIAWAMQIRERAEAVKIQPSLNYVWNESFRWGIINIIGGAMLFSYIPGAVVFLTGGSSEFVIGIIIAGVQYHHFIVDGVIWKLKKKGGGSPLMMNLSEFLKPQKIESEKAYV